jgi:hypothetical protein
LNVEYLDSQVATPAAKTGAPAVFCAAQASVERRAGHAAAHPAEPAAAYNCIDLVYRYTKPIQLAEK